MIDLIGGPDRDRTDDLFHAMEARSQLRHRPTLLPNQLLDSLRSGPSCQTPLNERFPHSGSESRHGQPQGAEDRVACDRRGDGARNSLTSAR